jgi:ATP-binding cassette subfamily C protein
MTADGAVDDDALQRSMDTAMAQDLASRLEAERFEGLHGRVVDLSDPETVWIVLAGRVDVQVLALRDGIATTVAQHLFEATTRFLLPGTPPVAGEGGVNLSMAGRCSAGTILYRTTRTKLRDLLLDLDALIAIEDWVAALAAAGTPLVRTLSTDLVEADPDQVFPADSVLCAPHATVVWVEVTEGAALALGDELLRLEPGQAAWPLTEGTWLQLPVEAKVNGYLTPSRMATGEVWDDLDLFGRLMLGRLARQQAVLAKEAVARQARRAEWTRSEFQAAIVGLGFAADPRLRADRPAATLDDAWAEAFSEVAAAAGIPLSARPGRGADVETIALSAGVAFRTVKLESGWWKGDHGALLGFIQQEEGGPRAVALLPRKPGRYEAALGRGQRVPVDAKFAARLASKGIMLYRPLPARIKNLFELLRFGTFGVRRDFTSVLLMGILSGALGMAIPVATGFLMQEVLPRADVPLHITVIIGLAAAAFGNAAFSVVETVAMTRIQARIDLSAEAGVWNRLLRLQTRFFRDHPTGDLADRANGVSEIRRSITGVVTQSFLSGLFSLMSGVLLVIYSLPLALFAALFTAVVVLVEVALFAVQLPRRRRVVASAGKVDTVAFETLSAMSKLRAAAVEPRAFARWSAVYAEQARLRRSAAEVDNWRAVINGAIPLAGSAMLFAGVSGMLTGGAGSLAIPFGSFVAFNAAFGNFLGGVLKLVSAGETIVGVFPVWERLKVILQAEQETGLGRTPIATVRGALQLSNVTFAYNPEAPPVLDGVTLSIEPGEYVALVGPSGSGKSTVIRLLLGLEQPLSGAVYVDGQDLATIDLAAMRRQFGVVLQNGQISAGSILENIIGSAALPESAAWEAAKQAGLANDIWAMPMRMQTVISDGGGDLSGGQRQRMLIARALVRRPRVLLFDEATSALDNVTQSAVQQSLERLNITRVVVAHRLSTIREAHRIIVMAAGRIVEEGGYDALVARGGIFAQLVARQVA